MAGDQQTVGLRLDLDADSFKKELAASGKAADELAGDMAGMGGKIDRIMSGIVGSAQDAEQGIRGVDARLEQLTGADRELFLRANISDAEAGIRQIDQMLADPTLTDTEISIVLDRRNQASAQIEKLKGDLEELEVEVKEVGETGERSFGVLAGAIGSAAVAGRLDEAVTSSGKLRAQLGLTADEAREFDAISKEVYQDNFGESMGHAAQVTGQVHQALRLVDDELLATTEGVLSIDDAFEHLGAETDLTLNAVRTLKANFPGKTDAEILDLIANGFQAGAGRAGDFLDVLNEYPGDFSRIGLSADDMVGIINEGLDAGVWNADRVGDAVREMGIRITTAGDLGQVAIRKMFPPEEAERLIRDFGRGGEAGRAAFFTIMDGLTQIEDPAERFNRSVELMGSLGEELANQFPGMRDGLLAVRDGTVEAGTGVEGLSSQYDGFRNTLEGLVRQLETGVLGTLGDVGVGFADVGSNVGIAVLGLKGLHDLLPGMPTSLGGVAKGLGRIAAGAAAYGAAAWGLSQMGDAIADIAGVSGPDISNLRRELELLARTGQSPGDLGTGRIALAIDEIIDPSFWESAGGTVSRGIDFVGQAVTLGMLDLRGTATQYSQELGAVDDVLAGMVESGNADQAREVFRQIAEAVEDSGHDASVAAEAFPGYTSAMEIASARAGELQGVSSDLALDIGAVSGAVGVGIGPIEGYGDASGDAGEQVLSLADSIRAVADEHRAALDPLFAAQDAMLDLQEAQRDAEQANWDVLAAQEEYTKAVDQFGRKSPEATRALWNLEQAERDADQASRDAARAALDLDSALLDLKAGVEDGTVSFDNAVGTLDRWVREGKITEDQARLMKEELFFAAVAADEMDQKSITPEMDLDTTKFWLKWLQVQSALGSDKQNMPQIGPDGRFVVRKKGGPIPGAIDQPVPVLAHGGEFVLNADATRSIGLDALHALNRGEPMPATYMAPSSVSSSSSTTDARSVEIHNHYPRAETAEGSTTRTLHKAQLFLT